MNDGQSGHQKIASSLGFWKLLLYFMQPASMEGLSNENTFFINTQYAQVGKELSTPITSAKVSSVKGGLVFLFLNVFFSDFPYLHMKVISVQICFSYPS